MAGRLTRYAFVNAKLRTRLSKMIGEHQIQKVIRARSLGEAIQMLRDMRFAFVESVYSRTGDLRMVELELFTRQVELCVEVRNDVAGEVREFVNALAIRFEVDTLKNALRLWFDRCVRRRAIENSLGYLYRGLVAHNIQVDQIINVENLSEVATVLTDTPYETIVRQQAERVLADESLFPVEVGLDRYYYSQLMTAVQGPARRDSALAQRVIGAEIDLQNINWIARFKLHDLAPAEATRYLIPQGRHLDVSLIHAVYEGKDVTELLAGVVEKGYPALRTLLRSESSGEQAGLILLEQILNQIMLLEVRRVLAGNPFTVGVILAYFYLKLQETRRIVSILNAKHYGLDAERVQVF